MMNMFFFGSNTAFMILFGVLGLVILILIASKVHEHATHHHIPMPFLWVILAITMPVLGLLIYLIVASTYSQHQYNVQPLSAARSTPSPSMSPSEVITRPQESTTSMTSVKTPTMKENQLFSTNLTEKRFCQQCGSVVGLDDLFCSYCGAKLN